MVDVEVLPKSISNTEDALAEVAAEEYDVIHDQYQESKQLPWRTYVEAPALMNLAGDLQGQRVIDLACGEGFYTRKLARAGAADVLGVDISPEMVRLAETQEGEAPMGIRYTCADVRDLPQMQGVDGFDLAFAGFLLNYATSYEHLLHMLQGVAHSLKPGGRFVSVNDSFLQDPATYMDTKHHGFTKKVEGDGPRVEGSPIVYTFTDRQGATFSFHNYWLSPETYERAFKQAGFSSFRFFIPTATEEGMKVMGRDYFAVYDSERSAPIIMLEAHK